MLPDGGSRGLRVVKLGDVCMDCWPRCLDSVSLS